MKFVLGYSCYSETISSFLVLLLWFVRWVWSSAPCGANYFLLLRQDLYEYFSYCPMNYTFSSLTDRNRLFPSLCDCYAFRFFWMILLVTGIFPTCVYWSVFCRILEGKTLQVSGILFLHIYVLFNTRSYEL